MSELRELREEDADAVAVLFVEAWSESRRMDGGQIREWLRNEALKPENLRVLVEGHELELLVAARGYRTLRASYMREIELDDEPPPPPPPAPVDGIEIRTYRPDEDEQRTYGAQEESFADHWGHNPQPIETWRAFGVQQSNFDPSLWFLAWDGDEVAGFSLNFPERSGDPGYGWVGTLGVRRAWRRRGIGEALLRHSFRALHERGQRRVRLSVDVESLTGATRLYERAGMRVLRQSNTWELRLDAG